MPRWKQWRRSEKRKREWRDRSRIVGGDGAVADRKRSRTDCSDTGMNCSRL